MATVGRVLRIAIALSLAVPFQTGCKDGHGSGAAPVAPLPVVARGPYLQLGSPHGASIVWRTSEPVVGAARILRDDGSLAGEFAEAAAATEHVIEIAGLDAGATYTYTILGDGDAMVGPFRLRTFPAPDADAIRFVAMGDCGLGTVAQEAVAERILDLDPLIVLIAGDVMQSMGAAEEYERCFFEPYRDLLPETFVCPALGNHDYYTGWGQPYLDVFLLPANNPDGLERYYSFDAGPCHFVSVDSNWPFDPGTAQHDWLDADLAATDRTWKVVFFHHPPYGTSAIHPPDPRVQAALVPLFDAHRVDLVLCGHNHHYERMFPLRGGGVVGADQEPDYAGVDGTIYVVTGGGGAFLYPRDPALPTDKSAFFAERHHVVEVSIEGDALRLRAIAAEGDILDQATWRKP
ncbi:MAG: metallophosphoesterase [Planctomycetes bacterium]|nr:metallophosphoesterase [Planctomycetota bacterium]